MKQKLNAADIDKLLEDPVYGRAINQVILNRLGEKLDNSTTLLKSRRQLPATQKDNTARILDSLIIEHLNHEGLVMTQKVYEPEARLYAQDKLSRQELKNYIGNSSGKLAYFLESSGPQQSLLRLALVSVLDSTPAIKNASTQTVSMHEDLERKLQQVEGEWIIQEQMRQAEERGKLAQRGERERQRFKQEVEKEVEIRVNERVERAVREAREKERENYTRRLAELERLAERKLSEKIKSVRIREAEVIDEGLQHHKQIEGLRNTVERKLIEDMLNLDKEKAALLYERQKDYERFKTLDAKLDYREQDILTREKFQEVHKTIAEESLQNKSEAIKHLQHARANMESRHQAILDGLVEKSETLQLSLNKRESELSEMQREIRKRELELEARQKKSQEIQEENQQLRDALNTQVAVGKKKETTLMMYERRIDSLTEENIKVKESINNLKKNWIMLREVRPETATADEFKPII